MYICIYVSKISIQLFVLLFSYSYNYLSPTHTQTHKHTHTKTHTHTHTHTHNNHTKCVSEFNGNAAMSLCQIIWTRLDQQQLDIQFSSTTKHILSEVATRMRSRADVSAQENDTTLSMNHA